jgi:hypothetical protein
MGWSLSWLATRGKSAQAVRDELGFRATDVRRDILEADLSGAELRDGWYLIVSRQTEQVALDSVLEHLSLGCEVVTCFLEEHAMVSSAAGWKDGRRCWAVAHDGQTGIEHLQVEGELPPTFASIRDRLRSKQQEDRGPEAEVDHIFDIPIETARAVTGYRHDVRIPELPDDVFEVLAGRVPVGVKKSFWDKLFGT